MQMDVLILNARLASIENMADIDGVALPLGINAFRALCVLARKDLDKEYASLVNSRLSSLGVDMNRAKELEGSATLNVLEGDELLISNGIINIA